MKINIKKLSPNAKLPTYGSENAAGMDLYALIEEPNKKGEFVTEIAVGTTKKIHTGIAVEIPEGYVGLIFARSGLATKKNLSPANAVGVIDADYRGEVIVALHNYAPSSIQSGTYAEFSIESRDCYAYESCYNTFDNQPIENGDRIAQLVIVPYIHAELNEVKELSKTKRGEGGFGSTGTN